MYAVWEVLSDLQLTSQGASRAEFSDSPIYVDFQFTTTEPYWNWSVGLDILGPVYILGRGPFIFAEGSTPQPFIDLFNEFTEIKSDTTLPEPPIQYSGVEDEIDVATGFEPLPWIGTAQLSKLELKAIFKEGDGDHFHLYVTVNEETDYYVGYYWPGVNFEFNDNEISWVSDAPENALVAMSTMWTGEGQWFYIYQKNDSELALMNHPVIYPEWYINSVKSEIGDDEYENRYKKYQEILIIPIEKGSEILIEKAIIVQKPQGSVG